MKAALITGAASGIGRALALALADEGVAVAGVDLNAAGLADLERELLGKGRAVATAAADVTDPAALTAAVASLATRLPDIDLLIASAGLGYETSALSYDAEAAARLLRVNLLGVSNSVAAVLPGMLARRRGHLVALSSLASFRGLPLMAAYCASKAGVNALLESLRVELRPAGVAVTTVCPGWIRTPMTDRLNLPPREVMPVEMAARHILRAVRRREEFVAFPAAAARRLRLLSWLPRRWADALVARMLRRLRAQ